MKQTTELSAHSNTSQNQSLSKDQNEERFPETKCLFFNLPKIRCLSKIQEKLIDWRNETSESKFESIFLEIPTDYLNNKDDLMTICELFARFFRGMIPLYSRLGIKLFERIMPQIKSYLNNESEFFWGIFGESLYYKLWFYEEGLISIKTIILKSINDKTGNVAKYFLPEIISCEPEYFDLELKFIRNLQVSDAIINEMKDKRVRLFKWLKSSGNYHDEEYRQLQNDPLLLAIKTDDLNLFQDILSKTNQSIDTKCHENLIEHFFKQYDELSLIELACAYNSTNIIQFLLLNQAQLSDLALYSIVRTDNYEILHLFESKMKIKILYMFYTSILSWNFEMIDYCINTYDINISQLDPKDFFEFFNYSFLSMNFIFIESYLIPFLNSNIDFYNSHVSEIFISSISNLSCFFFKELLKNPNVDVNYDSETEKNTILTQTIIESNLTAFSLLLNHPQIDVNKAPKNHPFSPLQKAIGNMSYPTIIKKLCLHPKINIHYLDLSFNINAFELFCKGHTYGFNIFCDIFPDYQDPNFEDRPIIMNYWLNNKMFYSLKLYLQFILKSKIRHSTKFKNDILKTLESVIESIFPFKDEYRDSFRKMLASMN